MRSANPNPFTGDYSPQEIQEFKFIQEQLTYLRNTKVYGRLVLELKGGKVVLVRLEQTLKLPEDGEAG